MRARGFPPCILGVRATTGIRGAECGLCRAGRGGESREDAEVRGNSAGLAVRGVRGAGDCSTSPRLFTSWPFQRNTACLDQIPSSVPLSQSSQQKLHTSNDAKFSADVLRMSRTSTHFEKSRDLKITASGALSEQIAEMLEENLGQRC